MGVVWLNTEAARVMHRRALFYHDEKLMKYGGFDLKDCGGLATTICDELKHPCRGLVKLYARMGLHRYNLLEGTNYELIRVRKYNFTTAAAACSFYITLTAKDRSSSSHKTIFQTKVSEKSYGKFILTCCIAKPRGTSTKWGTDEDFRVKDIFPKCPSENPFQNTKLFYLLKDSEIQENDWIRLYLELAIATTDRGTGDHDLSHLKILKVSIETRQDVEPSLKAKNAIVYIRYKDSCEARVGKNVDRIAIVRRTYNENTRCFDLVGQNHSSEILPKKSAKLLLRQRLGVHKPWRLSAPRWSTGLKSRGVGLARCLRKARYI